MVNGKVELLMSYRDSRVILDMANLYTLPEPTPGLVEASNKQIVNAAGFYQEMIRKWEKK